MILTLNELAANERETSSRLLGVRLLELELPSGRDATPIYAYRSGGSSSGPSGRRHRRRRRQEIIAGLKTDAWETSVAHDFMGPGREPLTLKVKTHFA